MSLSLPFLGLSNNHEELFGTNISNQEKAMSENLPVGSEDWVSSLEIADKVKAKTIPAKSASASIKRRLLDRNPNVQILALKLTDVCIKNCGAHFHNEIVNKDFFDTITALGRGTFDGTNPDVRLKALELIQSCAFAFKNKSGMYYSNEIYQELKREGIKFPKLEHADSLQNLIETQTVFAVNIGPRMDRQ